jgi:Carboxypeptidase regulatory-like domain
MACGGSFSSGMVRLFFIIGVLTLSSFPLFAGDVLRFSGTVTDPTGAVVPHAQITVVNEGTAARQVIETDAQGWYEILLPAGIYRMQAGAAGFKPYVQTGLVLGPTAPLRADVVLQLASHQETVVVTTMGAEIDTASTKVGEGISQEKMTAVPLNGRSYTDLLALQAGVIPVDSAQPNAVVMSGCTSTPPSGDLNPGNMSVSGQREDANGFWENGSFEEDFN